MRLLPLLALLSLAACARPEPPALAPADQAERDSVLAVLERADFDALAGAFDRLDAYRYRLETRAEQLDLDGDVQAFRTVDASVSAGAADLVHTDSGGVFETGRLAFLAPDADDSLVPADNPAALVLPESPAFLDPRGREAFAFGFAADTLLGDRRVRVVTVSARPGEGDDQPLRHVRLYLDGAQLVGARAQRRTSSLIFRAKEDATILLHPGDGGWLPRLTRFEATVDALFAAPRRFRLVRRYGDLTPALAAEAGA